MEAPETAGTALKTVVARLSEVKELYSQGQLLGTDEEGQEIDVNNISKALRSAGINLNEYLAGAKGLDDILLELSSKWDSLDIVQQRYIATMAAGSRQQSRFIAMMSDYDRTVELVDAANNSAGASQKQYEKTLESMETSLTRLKNAWNEFTQGLANNQVLKFGIDLITALLNGVNGLTGALGDGAGAVAKFFVAFGALKAGKAIFSRFGEVLSQESSVAAGEAGQKASLSFVEQFQNRRNLQKNLKDFPKDFTNALSNALQKKSGKGISWAGFFSGFEKEIKATDLKKLGLSDIIEQQYADIRSGLNIDISTVDGQNKIRDLDNALNDFHKNLNKTGLSAAEAMEPLDNALMKSGKTLVVTGDMGAVAGQKIAMNMQTASAAVGALGMAAGLLSQALESAGMDNFAEDAQIVSNNLLVLTGILQVIPVLCKAIGLSITAIPIVGWIAAGVAGLITIVQIIEKNTEDAEERAKRLSETTKEAQSAAEEAKSAYDKLLQDREEYNETQNTLDNLITGTKEWKEELIKVNDQVIQLLNTYPELAKYLTRNEDGSLSLKPEGWTEVEEKAQQQANAAQSAALSSSIIEQENKARQSRHNLELTYFREMPNLNKMVYDAIIKSNNIDEISWDIGVDEEEIKAMADLLKDMEFLATSESQTLISTLLEYSNETGNIQKFLIKNGDEYSDALKNLAIAFSISEDEAYKAAEAVAAYSLSAQSTSTIIESSMKAILTTNLKEGLTKSEYSSTIIEGLSSSIAENYYETVSKYLSELNDRNKDDIQELINELRRSGKSITNESGGIETYRQIYTALGGTAETKDWDQKKLSEEIAKLKINKDLSDSVNTLISQLEGLSSRDKELADEISDLIGGEKGLTKKEIDYYTNSENSIYYFIDQLQKYAKKLNYDDISAWAESLGMQEQELVNFFKSRLIDMSEASKELKSDFESVGLNEDFYESLIKSFDVGLLSNLTDKLEEIKLRSGQAASSAVSALLEGMLENINSEEDKEKFLEIFNVTDWSKIDQIEGFAEELDKAGISIKGGTKEIDNFTNEIIDLNNAVRSISFDSFKEKMISLSNLANDIRDRKDTERTFSEEEMNLIVDYSGVDRNEFVMTNTGEFIYIGENLVSIANSIDKRVGEILHQSVEDTKRAVDIGSRWAAVANTDITEGNFEGSAIKAIEKIIGGDLSNLQTVDDRSKFLKVLVSRVGANIDSEGNRFSLKGFNEDELIQLLKNSYDAYYGANGAKYAENQAEHKRASLAEIETQYTSASSGQELLNIAATTPEEDEAKRKAIEALMRTNEGLVISFNRMQKSLQNVNPELAENEDLLKTHAYDLRKSQEEIENLNTVLDDNTEVFKNANEESDGYIIALYRITEAAKKVFGEHINEEFVHEYKEQFLQLAEGGEAAQDAFETLGQKSAEKYLEGFNNKVAEDKKLSEEEQKRIQEITDQILSQDIEVGASIDLSGPFAELMKYFDDIKDIVDYLNSLGIQVNYKEVATPLSKPLKGKDETSMVTLGANGETLYTPLKESRKFKSLFEVIGTREDASGITGDTGDDSGNKKEEEPWENPYDWLYNMTEKINKNLREREKLERRYNKLVESRLATANELKANSDDELAKLEAQRKLREETLALREEEMRRVMDENQDMLKYGSYNFDTGLIKIEWEDIDAVTDTEEGQKIEDYISKLEEVRDYIWEQEDGIEDIEDQIDEINERGKDEYSQLEDRIKDAIINAREEEIDKLSAINDSINDTNSKLIDSIQSVIDQQRQDRENQKAEDEISENQRRLVYLQQDTSGANALEILQLQDEISEAQESYTDQLIDQKISELQKQNDAAADQRQRQIGIMTAQLEYDKNYGEIARQTQEMMLDLMQTDGVVVNNSNLANLLMDSDGFGSLTGFQAKEWFSELHSQASLATLYYKQQLEGFAERNFDSEIRKAVSDGNLTEAGRLERLRNQQMVYLGRKDDQTYSYQTGEWSQWGASSSQPAKPSTPAPETGPSRGETSAPTDSDKKKVAAAIWRGGLGWGNGAERRRKLEEVFGSANGIQGLVDKGVGKYDGGSDVSEYSYEKMRRKYKGYKTGGLADFTGPAWLDGTPSKPEIILNQKDSQNFIQLKDILSSLLNAKSGDKTESNGDNYYDIDINVEKVEGDYTVEQMAAKLKDMIRADATYRNVNVINNVR